MSNGYRCRCARCTIHGLMGPAVLITIGVIFLIGQMSWRFGFGELWPLILLVIGAIKLAESLASTEGHVGPAGPPMPPQGQQQIPPPQPPMQPPPPPQG